MSSVANDSRYKSQREYFDRPVAYKSGNTSSKVSSIKPMEVYHKITPVRSIQQSINLIRALKTEQKEILDKTRPKSVIMQIAGYSDSYGTIPNLRVENSKTTFLPIKEKLSRSPHSKAKMIKSSQLFNQGDMYATA